MKYRSVDKKIQAKATMEGAGVRLHRGFGFHEVPQFDPFLLFDDFSSPEPEDYMAGFPWHPHRGIETVTYILDGKVAHEDSIGNAGVIGAGDVQWMTSGSGIVHQEMPQGTTGIQGFQLWVNLPKANKMDKPRYQEFQSNEMPEFAIGKNASIKVIAGEMAQRSGETLSGPVTEIEARPFYADVRLNSGSLELPVEDGHTAFIYIFDGSLAIKKDGSKEYKKGDVVLFERDGNTIYTESGDRAVHFLYVTGKPVNESIAWRGPIVMNTDEELAQAFTDLYTGNFIKKA